MFFRVELTEEWIILKFVLIPSGKPVVFFVSINGKAVASVGHVRLRNISVIYENLSI